VCQGAFSSGLKKQKAPMAPYSILLSNHSDAVELTGTIEDASVVKEECNNSHDGNSQADIRDTHEEALFLSVV
jgi:hypothetical protein